MRFSLATLLLVVIWCGTSGLIWALREPWVKTAWPEHIPKFKNRDEFLAYFKTYPYRSPDGTRVIGGVNPSDGFEGPMGFSISDAYYYAIMWGREMRGKASREELERAESRWILGFYGIEYFEKYGNWSNAFADDDTILLFLLDEDDNAVVEHKGMRRRFPEWWWGHFYRLEVWALGVLTVVLVVRFVRGRRRLG